MSGFEKVFQRMDETIADVCLRELDWDQTSPHLWQPGADETITRARIAEVYRLGRPLILHLVKMDKSPVKNLKKLSIARSMMDVGKKTLESNQPLDALGMYNKAVVFSPNIDDNLAKACADRAACLLRLGDYGRALSDIEQAELAEYQFERRFELDERKGLAYLGLGQYDKARAALNQAVSLLEDAAGFLHRRFVERKMGELQEALASCGGGRMAHPFAGGNSLCNGTSMASTPGDGKFDTMRNIAELRGRNTKYPAVSDKVEVEPMARNGRGRSFVSRGNIRAGDILGMERPIASFLEKDFIKSNCWNCLVTLKAPYGCPLCSAVKFCSKACLREACSTYHPSECLLTDLIISNQISSWHLAYRAVSSRSLKQNLLVSKNGAPNNEIYHSADLNNLVNFPLPVESVSRQTSQEIKQRTIMSVFYLILLQMTGYFDDNNNSSSSSGSNKGSAGAPINGASSDLNGHCNNKPPAATNPSMASIYQMKGKANDSTLSENEMSIARLLDRVILATCMATTEVCHFEMEGRHAEWTAGKVTPVIGKTINPTLALVPHSCYPTAARVCFENKTLLIAQKSMTAGEPVTINYSAPFYAASRSDRQQYLTAGYVFNCECDACRANWPLFDELPSGPAALAANDMPIAAPATMSETNGAGFSLNGKTALPQQTQPTNVFRPVDPFGNSQLCPQLSPPTNNSISNNSHNCQSSSSLLTQTERSVMETFQRVCSKLDQLQRSTRISERDPPSKIMIQNQVRLFRCLLAMYSSKLYIHKTGYGTLSMPV